MFILAPKTLSADSLGCCVVRVIEPVTPRECAWAMQDGGHPLWRVTLWRAGQIWFGYIESPEAPTIAQILNLHDYGALLWVEIVRTSA